MKNKSFQLNKISDKISKVGMEIDSAQKELTLLNPDGENNAHVFI